MKSICSKGEVNIITLPPKVWRPKPGNICIPLDYDDGIDDGIFDYSYYVKVAYIPKER